MPRAGSASGMEKAAAAAAAALRSARCRASVLVSGYSTVCACVCDTLLPCQETGVA